MFSIQEIFTHVAPRTILSRVLRSFFLTVLCLYDRMLHMKKSRTHTDTHSAEGEAFTSLILETFRFNGQLLAAGDRLTRGLGLSSARWQVLGALADASLPVAQIARNMGLKRQSVQRLVDILAKDGLVEFAENPNHRRAKLVALTEQGHATLEEITRIQIVWANRLTLGLNADELELAVRVIQTLRERLEKGE